MIAPLSQEIARLMAPQQRFETLRERTLLHSGRELCDLAYANAYDGPPASVLAALHDAIDSRGSLDLQYTPYGGATVPRRLVARQLGAAGGERFHWRDVVLTPGAMAALNIVFRSVRVDHAANEIVVLTPCWLDYPLYLENLGITPRFAKLARPSLRLDLDAIAAALGPATRAVVLSQPANPSGLIYSRNELEDLARILEDAPGRPVLISDESHRDVCFEFSDFVPPADCYDRTCVIYSFGKSRFLQGQRLGYVAVSPRFPDRRRYTELLEQLCRAMGFCTPTSLMQRAVAALLPEKPDLSAVEARRQRTLLALKDSGYPVVSSQATFFLYPEVSKDDFAFTERLAARGVLVLPASLFHDTGHVRISLTATDEMLERALPILAEEGPAAEARS